MIIKVHKRSQNFMEKYYYLDSGSYHNKNVLQFQKPITMQLK